MKTPGKSKNMHLIDKRKNYAYFLERNQKQQETKKERERERERKRKSESELDDDLAYEINELTGLRVSS